MSVLERLLADLGAVAFLAPLWLWLFKAAATRALDRSLHQQLESHKHELQALGDKLRHNLQREMLLAELRTKRVFEVYPKLFEVFQLSAAAIRRVQELKTQKQPEQELLKAKIDARDKYIDAKNYAVLNRIFLSKEVLGAAEACDKKFLALLKETGAEPGSSKSLTELTAEYVSLLDTLVDVMGTELSPREVTA